MKLSIRGREELAGSRPMVMGILNLTRDSFYDGGMYANMSAAVDRALVMVDQGADMIDVGGESTRPGSESVSEEDELKNVIPVISAVSNRVDVPISIDTYKTRVASEALDAGADIINDISALRFGEGMAELAAERKVPVILMHMKGDPQTMQDSPAYEDVIKEIGGFLRERVDHAVSSGISRDMIAVDPGIGFGKTTEHNLEIVRKLSAFKETDCPVLIGPSRKSFIGNVLDLPVEERLEGTAAAVAVSVLNGADIVRVHDVKEMVRVVRMASAFREA